MASPWEASRSRTISRPSTSFEAIGFVRDLARSNAPLTEMALRNLHRLAILRSRPDIGGSYTDQGRYVLTDAGRHAFPSSSEVPASMGGFVRWLRDAAAGPEAAFAAHRELAGIHPFDDGNGRTARLLMNLVLIRGGYPPVAVRPLDRPAYIAALQQAQAGRGTEAFDRLLYERLDETLDEYVSDLSRLYL